MPILDLFRLDDQVAVVTGASRGLGQALAKALAEAGADIVSVARGTEAPETAAMVTAAGRRFWSVAVDLSEPEQRRGVIERVLQQTGRIDILVNNAGVTHRAPPEEFPLQEWQRLMEVHVTAAFDLSQQAALHFLPRGSGKIINIGSVMTFQGGHLIPAYAAAKHAIAGLTKSLSNAWASRGIQVNCICPGYFETRMSDSLQDDPVRGPQILQRIPAGRWGQPDELGGAVVFLASRASNYVQGSLLTVDGGWMSR
jgi:2-dehydro-3-deoxy-D-gluconate 5-dehydrogenase